MNTLSYPNPDLIKEMCEVYELFHRWEILRKDIECIKSEMEQNSKNVPQECDSRTIDSFRLKMKSFQLLTNLTIDRASNLRGPLFNPSVSNMRSFPTRAHGHRSDPQKYRRDITKAKEKMIRRHLSKEKLLRPSTAPLRTRKNLTPSPLRVHHIRTTTQQDLSEETREREKKIMQLKLFERSTNHAHVPQGMKKKVYFKKQARPYTAPVQRMKPPPSRFVQQTNFRDIQMRLRKSLAGSFSSPHRNSKKKKKKNRFGFFITEDVS